MSFWSSDLRGAQVASPIVRLLICLSLPLRTRYSNSHWQRSSGDVTLGRRQIEIERALMPFNSQIGCNTIAVISGGADEIRLGAREAHRVAEK